MDAFSNSQNLSTTQDSSSNSTHSLNLPPLLKETFYISGLCVAILSFIATTANGLLLLALWRDPHKKFRIPSTIFVIGLTMADFLTGLLVGPLIAYNRITVSIAPNSMHNDSFRFITKVVETMSLITMNASYLILLCLTWNQFIATRFPHKHRNLVTARKVTICVVSAWVYAISFAMLPILGVQKEIIYRVDFYAHNCAFILLLVIAYTCLLVAFRRQASRIRAATNECLGASFKRTTGQRRRSQKQFTVIALGLVIFIVICTLPSTIIYAIYTYSDHSTMKKVSLLIAREVSGVVLFLKFSLDPFLYCWRLVAYRKALKSIITCGRIRYEVEEISASVRSTRRVSGRPCHSMPGESVAF